MELLVNHLKRIFNSRDLISNEGVMLKITIASECNSSLSIGYFSSSAS
jgi:hypothetical protein